MPIMMIGPAIRRMANMLQQQLDPTLAFSLCAFDHEMRLWKETNGDDWGAAVGNRSNQQVYYLYFEAKDPTLAKLQVLGTARALALLQMDKEIPPADAFIDSWRPLAWVEPVESGTVSNFALTIS
jgi:hypothetical protein